MTASASIRLLSLLFAFATIASPAGQAAQALRVAVPVEPIGAIIDAFRSHSVVALPNSHGNEQVHAFDLALIRDPRTADTVDDIVVEFGNSRYQDIIDRFVRGDAVPQQSLRQVWQNTTVAGALWDAPIYEEFFRAIRTVNAARPGKHQLRVLLGDPPIDWDVVNSESEYRKWIELRDSYPAELIRREVLARHRRALVVYGVMHLQRKNISTNYEMTQEWAHTIVSRLESTAGERVFSIWSATDTSLDKAQPDISSWPVPSLSTLRGITLGAMDFTSYIPVTMTRFALQDGKPVTVPREQWQSLRMENQFDALLYLGSPAIMTTARPAAALCTNTDYMEMRLKRLALMSGSQGEIDRLKQYCLSQMPK